MTETVELTRLLERYDVQVPRYTSYPAVPYWDSSLSSRDWLQSIRSGLEQGLDGWALYIHIPFCETLCTFCGCNNIITRNHEREGEYVDLLKKELSLYLQSLPELGRLPLKQIHLGGGSPTFLSAENLKALVENLRESLNFDLNGFEGAIEVDPRRTHFEQLSALKKLGFNRVSIGVQDFDSDVQRSINRIQPAHVVQRVMDWSQSLGYESINFDLIYGLPKQTLNSLKETIESTLRLRPERIALYSLASVPWIKPAQKLFKDSDLPKGAAKRRLYEVARDLLLKGGYLEIGIDHFALPHDALALAQKNNQLHRNFMGYTNLNSEFTLALGVSGISESTTCFHQNLKDLSAYTHALLQGEIPTLKGHKLSAQDQQERRSILELMTQLEVRLPDEGAIEDARSYLRNMLEDGLIEIQGNLLRITPVGAPFVRNVCTLFDRYTRQTQPLTRIFSSAL